MTLFSMTSQIAKVCPIIPCSVLGHLNLSFAGVPAAGVLRWLRKGVVFPRGHGGDDLSEVPLTIGRQEIANPWVGRVEPEESRLQNVGGYHYILLRRTGRSWIGRANIWS